MSRIPSVELLNATHTFPTIYTFKAIGLSGAGFVDAITAAAKAEMGVDVVPMTKQTPDGRHTSVTLELKMASAEKIVAIYQRLLTVPGLVLLL